MKLRGVVCGHFGGRIGWVTKSRQSLDVFLLPRAGGQWHLGRLDIGEHGVAGMLSPFLGVGDLEVSGDTVDDVVAALLERWLGARDARNAKEERQP